MAFPLSYNMMGPFPFRSEGIMQNGKRAQDHTNVFLNNATYASYLDRLVDIAMVVFEWKNLPDGIDERQIEWWLLQYGFVGFFYDEALMHSSHKEDAPEGYAVLPIMLQGEFSLYNIPRHRRAYAVNGFQKTLDQLDSVIIFNSYSRTPMLYKLMMYALRLAEIERTIDVNVHQQKTPKVIRCSEAQRQTFLNFVKQVEENQYAVMGDKHFDPNSAMEVLDVTAPYVSNDLQVLKHQLWNEAMTFLGIENVNTEKKERLVSDEVFSNMGDVEVERFTRLQARKQACDQINKRWGLDVDVDFRSGVYIRGDGIGAQAVKTDGMEPSSMDMGGGYE